FVLDCETFLGESVGGVTVHDFHHGVDLIEFSTIGTNPSLTNEGELWTVHTDLGNSTFTIVGVTHLDTTDYAFVINGDRSENTLIGTNADDILNGFGGNDTLNGFEGNDTLDGGTGIDQMNGGSGNDTFLFSEFTDHIDGGSGFDAISFAKTNQGITLTNTSWNSVGGSVTQVEAITGS